jgi:hypothetical protein
MHLNDLSLIGNEAGEGGAAARAGPIISTATQTHNFSATDAAD